MILKENELNILCNELNLKQNKGIYLLSGNLSSGKTTLVKEMVKYLGISSLVTSPTYLLSHVYGDCVFHYDIYMRELLELLEFGLLEELEKDGWHFIEWGDEKLATILNDVGIKYTSIKISPKECSREYSICTN